MTPAANSTQPAAKPRRIFHHRANPAITARYTASVDREEQQELRTAFHTDPTATIMKYIAALTAAGAAND